MKRNRLGLAGVLAGIVFGIGLGSILLVPGGGDVTDKNFTDFYNSSGKRSAALLLYFVLVVGCWLMIWLFTELRSSSADSNRSEVAYRLAIGGAVLVMAGAGINLGPTGVQINSRNSQFVGVPVAHAISQAGLLTAVAGMFTLAAAVLLIGLELRRSATFPNWIGTLSIVFAVLLITAYIGIGAVLLPIWAIIVGVAAPRGVVTSPSSSTP